jgi:hypothetical protein
MLLVASHVFKELPRAAQLKVAACSSIPVVIALGVFGAILPYGPCRDCLFFKAELANQIYVGACSGAFNNPFLITQSLIKKGPKSRV